MAEVTSEIIVTVISGVDIQRWWFLLGVFFVLFFLTEGASKTGVRTESTMV